MKESDGLDNYDGSTDDEVALMPKKFKQIKKKKENFQHSSRREDFRFKKKNKEENNEIICFKCRKPGHMKDDLDNEKSNSSDNKQAKICLMANTDDKVYVKTSSKSDTSSSASSNDEEDMPYDVLLQSCHMISLQCKKFKEKFKALASENTKLRKSNENLKKKRFRL
ncbi:hypothetical protein HKD37_10G028022 [Glycine soja]